jgi:hypothetical protein
MQSIEWFFYSYVNMQKYESCSPSLATIFISKSAIVFCNFVDDEGIRAD